MRYRALRNFMNGAGQFTVGDLYPFEDDLAVLLRSRLIEEIPEEVPEATIEPVKKTRKKKATPSDGLRGSE